MKDEALEKIWKVRDSISAECGYDSRRMVKYLQERTEKRQRHQDRARTRPEDTGAASR